MTETIKKPDTSSYRMVADLHTHTIYSRNAVYLHGKGTVLENTAAAAAAGIKKLAITDHGPGHEIYGFDQRNIPQVRADIAEAMERYPTVEILFGIEANIVNLPNGLDVSREDFGKYDIVIAGYHYGTRHGHMVGNWISATPVAPSGSFTSLMIKNTEMTIRALYENDLLALTHPGDKGPFDMKELCRACEETNTLMEISARHKRLTVEEIRMAAEYNVGFIINSDAHKPQQVGTFRNALERALLAGLDVSRIRNVEEIR